MRPMHKLGLYLTVDLALLLVSGGCTSDSHRSPTVQAPAGLTYTSSLAVYTVGTRISANSPSSSGGAVTSYRVSPALPAGLNLDPATGVITGTPTGVTATTIYTVTASNLASSTQAPLSLSIVAPATRPAITAPATVTLDRLCFASVPAQAGVSFSWTASGATLADTTGDTVGFTATGAPGSQVQLQCVAVNQAGLPSADGTAQSVIASPPPATPSAGDLWTDPYTGAAFHFVPAGSYRMGSTGDPDGKDDEVPAHTVTFASGFWIGERKLSQADWVRTMGVDPAFFQANAAAQITGNPARPVENVSWEDSQQLIAALNALQSGSAYRLPSEAEWEFACRAGTSSPFSWGSSSMFDYAFCAPNAGGSTQSLAQKLANPWGLFDTAGDVMEWCADTYFPDYTGAPADGSARMNVTTAYRVLRGSAWNDDASDSRVSARYALKQTARTRTAGLRLVMPVSDAPRITGFTATPAAGGVTLAWTQTGAASLVIDHGVGTVTGTSTPVTVSQSTVFTLVAANAAGWSMATVTVAVQ